MGAETIWEPSSLGSRLLNEHRRLRCSSPLAEKNITHAFQLLESFDQGRSIVTTSRVGPFSYILNHRSETDRFPSLYRSFHESNESASAYSEVLDLQILRYEYSATQLLSVTPSPDGSFIAVSVLTEHQAECLLVIYNIALQKFIGTQLWNVSAEVVWFKSGQRIAYIALDSTGRRASCFALDVTQQVAHPKLLVGTQNNEEKLSFVGTVNNACVIVRKFDRDTSQTYLIREESQELTVHEVRFRCRCGVNCSVVGTFQERLLVIRSDSEGDAVISLPEVSDGSLVSDTDAEYLVRQSQSEGSILSAIEMNGSVIFSRRRAGVKEFCISSSGTPCSSKVLHSSLERTWELLSADPHTGTLTILQSSYSAPPVTIEIRLDGTILRIQKHFEGPKKTVALQVHRCILASEGTDVPLTILSAAGSDSFSQKHVLVHCYGAYGASVDPHYNPIWASLISEGWVIVVAHVRGGGEGGRNWHYSATGSRKMNSVRDLESVLRYLRDKMPNARICVEGASAGGTTVARLLNIPEACHLVNCALLKVPLLDLCGVMSDPNGYLVSVEYGEWGNPHESPMAAEQMRLMSPLESIRNQPYPSTLVIAALADDRIPLDGVLRWVDNVRETDHTDQNSILLLALEGVGHGGPTVLSAQREVQAIELSFLLHMKVSTTTESR